ncbi:hypothetical protein DXX98_03215 [Janibacter melonis]|nr:hypothetical protein [Janibacter melonis]
MEMTLPHPDDGAPDEAAERAAQPGAEDLRRATEQLRSAPPPRRAVEIADTVLRRAMAAPRRARLARSRHDDDLQVSTTAITATMRADVDTALAGAAVQQIDYDIAPDGYLAAVRLDLLVQYGSSLVDLADEARVVMAGSLERLLGAGDVPVVVHHVHVEDVTVGDPHVVDPGDESV